MGMTVDYVGGEYAFLSQQAYVDKMMEDFNMTPVAKPPRTPLPPGYSTSKVDCPEEQTSAHVVQQFQAAIGALHWLQNTRHGIRCAVSKLATIQRNPSKHHIRQLQNLFQFVYATKEQGILLDANPEMSIASDATNGADKGDRRSRIGSMVQRGSAVLCSDSSLSIIALSSGEAEVRAATEAVKTYTWIRQILISCKLPVPPVYHDIDASAAIAICEARGANKRTRHFDISLQFTRAAVHSGIVIPRKIATEDNPADLLTKIPPIDRFERHVQTFEQSRPVVDTV